VNGEDGSDSRTRYQQNMKHALPLILAATIVTDTLTDLHQAIAIPPHVEPDLRVSMPNTVAPVSSGSKEGGTEPLGRVRWLIFYRKMLRSRGNYSEMLTAFVETAREMRQLYPDLKPWQRFQIYNSLQSYMELTKLRTRRDYSASLCVIRQVLSIPDVFFAKGS
jgi:hypothetical protein